MRVFSINDSLRRNGFYLYKPIAIGGVANKITVGAVISKTEASLELFEYFNSKTNSWPLNTGWKLNQLLTRTMTAFLMEMDQVTIADITANQKQFLTLLKP